MQFRNKLALAVLLTLSFNAFSGDLHKCVINGKTAYSDKKCPGDKGEQTITKGTASTLETSAIRQQIMAEEIKKEMLLQQQLLQQQAMPMQSNPAVVSRNPEIEKAKLQAIKEILKGIKSGSAEDLLKAKYAQKLLDSLNGQKTQAEAEPSPQPPVQSPPQSVPSIMQ